MLTDHERIARQQSDPALLRLHRALSRLTGILTYMNTGAHPDDEHNGLLAALRFGRGMRVIVACSTRGEGGQNAIGPERGAALGVLRTREMEAAARVLDAGVVWLGHGPEDPVHDFGFSKNGDDTLERWGHERTVERLVRAYRMERPDIVCPTFLDVPGQHGHHRAMTRAAIEAFDLAADPAAFPEHLGSGWRPWQVAKFYLPAWSGAGTAYDDEEPPPPETVAVHMPDRDPVTGATYAQIGEWSRAWHRSQGMGVWRDEGRTRWPLHRLLAAGTTNVETDISDGLPQDLAGLAALHGLPAETADALRAAQTAMAAAVAAFPDGRAITRTALKAAAALAQARRSCPPEWQDELHHRIDRKAKELDVALFEAQGVTARATARGQTLAPGSRSEIETYVDGGDHPVQVSLVSNGSVTEVDRRTEGVLNVIAITVSRDARPSNPFPPDYDPLGHAGEVGIRLDCDFDGHRAARIVALEDPLLVVPGISVRFVPDAVTINLAEPARPVRVETIIEGRSGTEAGELTFEGPSGWDLTMSDGGVLISPPPGLRPVRTELRPFLDGEAAHEVAAIGNAPGGPAFLHRMATLPVLAVDARLPQGARVGYASGGNDRVGDWLHRLGVDVIELDPDRLERGDLSGLTTIVVGIFAFGTRPDLRSVTDRLHAWVEAGGHLVTLYHRPSDGWDPDQVPPRRLKIGLPSVRWRVTNPQAHVEVLRPGHPLLTVPNVIGSEDWAGWDKERGLYFAAEWDAAYEPLLALSDAGEEPLRGALLSAVIGRGRHTHTSLVLHHQLEKLVPGAFRLMANLVQPA